MEENQIQTESEVSVIQSQEPADADNSQIEQSGTAEPAKQEVQVKEGQSFEQQDPSEELILGKFKSVEDLSKAYEELQKYQGRSSEELGNLRKEMTAMNGFKEKMDFFNAMQNEYLEVISRDMSKYTAPEYFQDPTFREIYKEALLTFGADLDTDRMINLLETYVSTRISANEKKKAAQSETQNVLNSMTYDKNSKSSFTPPKKSFDEMTEQEIDEMLERLI